MTITNDDNDRHQNRCEKMEVNENIRSQYTIGSNDFILVDEVGERPKKNVKEKLHEFSSCLNSNSKTVFTYKTITKRLPILQWWPTYSSADCIGDLLAGITVGLTLIPQSMAYSALAGLPPQQGLYGSFIGSLMYVFLGTCKEVPMGPTAIISLMTYNTLHGLGPVYGTLLCFLTGVIQLIMGLVGLGFLIDFISGPVNSGFTSAVAILIVASQIKDLIGVKAAGTTLVDMIISISKDISHYQLGDTWLGIICIVVILLLRRMALCQIGPKDVKEQTMFHKIMNRSMWLIGTFRNSIVVIVSSYVGYMYIDTYRVFHYSRVTSIHIQTSSCTSYCYWLLPLSLWSLLFLLKQFTPTLFIRTHRCTPIHRTTTLTHFLTIHTSLYFVDEYIFSTNFKTIWSYSANFMKTTT